MPVLDSHNEFAWSVGPALAVTIGAAVMVATAIVVGLYFREARRRMVPRGIRWSLVGLRVSAVGAVATILLGPAVVSVEEQYALPPLVVLRDVSQSMTVVDRYERSDLKAAIAALVDPSLRHADTYQVPRHALADHLLERDDAALLRRMAEIARPVLVDFSTSTNPVALGDLNASPTATPTTAIVPKSRPDGRGTDLGAAIRAALEGETPAAIILLTDGQQTTRDDPQAAAELAGQRGVPLMLVGVGDPERPRNLAVTGVYARPHVWKGEPLEIEVWLAAQRLPPGPITLTLVESRIGDDASPVQENVIATRTQSISDSSGPTRVVFSHSVREPGKYFFSVRAEPVAGERETSDNQRRSLPVEVLDRDQLRVLVVAGAPSWDYQLVERLLSRDKTLTTAFWLQSRERPTDWGGTTLLEALPSTQEALHWFDVVLLLDPDPETLSPEWDHLLRMFAEQHSGGVLYMPGPRFATRWIVSPATAETRAILPVSWPDVATIEAADLLDPHARGWPMRVVAAEADHPLLRDREGGGTLAKTWQQPPHVYWTFAVEQVRPTARVLLEHGDPATRLAGGSRPLLVVDRFGSAMVAYLGMQGTWRWHGGDGVRVGAEPFWTRLVRFLAEGRAWEGHRFGLLQTDRDRYEVGDRISLTARRADRGEASEAASLRGTVRFLDQSEPLVLLSVPTEPGTFETTFTAKQAALHSFQVDWNADAGSEAAASEAAVLVELPRVEFTATWLDRDRLTELAQASGGRYFDWWEIDQLPAAIPDRREIVEARHPPIPRWDRSLVLFSLVAALGLEWALRRQYKWE